MSNVVSVSMWTAGEVWFGHAGRARVFNDQAWTNTVDKAFARIRAMEFDTIEVETNLNGVPNATFTDVEEACAACREIMTMLEARRDRNQ